MSAYIRRISILLSFKLKQDNEHYPHSTVKLHLGGCAYAQPREWGGFFQLLAENYPHSGIKLHLGGCANAPTSRVGRFSLLIGWKLSPLNGKSCTSEVARKRQPREWGDFLNLHTKNYSHSMVELHLGGCAYASTSGVGWFSLFTNWKLSPLDSSLFSEYRTESLNVKLRASVKIVKSVLFLEYVR